MSKCAQSDSKAYISRFYGISSDTVAIIRPWLTIKFDFKTKIDLNLYTLYIPHRNIAWKTEIRRCRSMGTKGTWKLVQHTKIVMRFNLSWVLIWNQRSHHGLIAMNRTISSLVTVQSRWKDCLNLTSSPVKDVVRNNRWPIPLQTQNIDWPIISFYASLLRNPEIKSQAYIQFADYLHSAAFAIDKVYQELQGQTKSLRTFFVLLTKYMVAFKSSHHSTQIVSDEQKTMYNRIFVRQNTCNARLKPFSIV